MATELGRIAALLQAKHDNRTPLQKRLAIFGRSLAYVVLGLCALLFVIGMLRGEPLMTMLLTAVSLAVAAIPESLPAVITTRDSAKAGLKTRADVLNTEQQLFGAKRDLARARYSYLLGMLQLKASAGTLVDGDLATINNLLARE